MYLISLPVHWFHTCCDYKFSEQHWTRDPNSTHSAPLKASLTLNVVFKMINEFWAITWQLHCLWIILLHLLLLLQRGVEKGKDRAAPSDKQLGVVHFPNYTWLVLTHSHILDSTPSVHWHSIIREKNDDEEHEQNTRSTHYQRWGIKAMYN